jgi:hypothetical protein
MDNMNEIDILGAAFILLTATQALATIRISKVRRDLDALSANLETLLKLIDYVEHEASWKSQSTKGIK